MFSTLNPPTTEDLRVALRREIADLDTKDWRFIPEQPSAVDATEMLNLIDRYAATTDPANVCGWDKVVEDPSIIKTILSQTAVITVREKKLMAFAAYSVTSNPFPIARVQAIAVDSSLIDKAFMRAIASMGVPGHRALLSLGYKTLISPGFGASSKVDNTLLSRVTLPLETKAFLRGGDEDKDKKSLDIAQWLTLMEQLI